MTHDPIRDGGQGDGTAGKPGRRARRRARAAGWTGLAVVLALACVFAGFLGFVDKVAAMKMPDGPVTADAIVVLTGGQKRIESGLDLLRRGAAPRLFISGVNPATTGNEIRRLTGSPGRLFSCCVDIGHDAIDTVGNAYETARWIRKRGYRHVLLVTNNYHMPRSLVELHQVDPQTDFIAYPVIDTDFAGSRWLARPHVVRRLVFEYVKYALASLRAAIGATTGTGLRTDEQPDAGRLTSRAGRSAATPAGCRFSFCRALV